MKLRFYSAAVTGVLAMVGTFAGMWRFTQRPIEDVICAAGIAYFASMGLVLALTEPDKRRRKHRARPLGDDSPVSVTLDRKEWRA